MGAQDNIGAGCTWTCTIGRQDSEPCRPSLSPWLHALKDARGQFVALVLPFSLQSPAAQPKPVAACSKGQRGGSLLGQFVALVPLFGLQAPATKPVAACPRFKTWSYTQNITHSGVTT